MIFIYSGTRGSQGSLKYFYSLIILLIKIISIISYYIKYISVSFNIFTEQFTTILKLFFKMFINLH